MCCVCCVLCACLECLTPHPVNQKTHRWRRRKYRRKKEGEERRNTLLSHAALVCNLFLQVFLLVFVVIIYSNAFIVFFSNYETLGFKMCHINKVSRSLLTELRDVNVPDTVNEDVTCGNNNRLVRRSRNKN